jgi:hypothetical protein
VATRPFGAQEQPKQPFTITIRAMKPSYKAGARVELKVVMTNTWDREIDAGSVYDKSIDIAYGYDVRDSAGSPVLYNNSKPSETQGSRMRTLKPGESVVKITNVARWVDFSEPGEYQIQLSRNIGDDEKNGVVKSNTITITVIPANPAPNLAK